MTIFVADLAGKKISAKSRGTILLPDFLFRDCFKSLLLLKMINSFLLQNFGHIGFVQAKLECQRTRWHPFLLHGAWTSCFLAGFVNFQAVCPLPALLFTAPLLSKMFRTWYVMLLGTPLLQKVTTNERLPLILICNIEVCNAFSQQFFCKKPFCQQESTAPSQNHFQGRLF